MANIALLSLILAPIAPSPLKGAGPLGFSLEEYFESLFRNERFWNMFVEGGRSRERIVEQHLLPDLERLWRITRMESFLEMALVVCNLRGLPPPSTLVDAISLAMRERNVDKDKRAAREYLHIFRAIMVLRCRFQMFLSEEDACAAVAEMEGDATGKPVSDEAVRKSYKRGKKAMQIPRARPKR
jgi:hypothetical protein